MRLTFELPDQAAGPLLRDAHRHQLDIGTYLRRLLRDHINECAATVVLDENGDPTDSPAG